MHTRRHYSPYGYKRIGGAWTALHGEVHGVIERPPDMGHGRVNHRPECAHCNIGSHGFICHFSDGSCLRSIQEKDGPDYGRDDIPADESQEPDVHFACL